MKRVFILIAALFSLQLHSNNNLNEISGIVTIANSPIQNVSVRVLNSSKETFTDENGKYFITPKWRLFITKAEVIKKEAIR